MWDSLKRQRNNRPFADTESSKSGFTLLELLTVLLLIGLVAGIAVPNLPTLFERLSFALERESFIRNLNSLPSSALESNQDLVLFGDLEPFSNDLTIETDEEYVYLEDLKLDVPYRSSSVKKARLEFPETWIVTVPQPILYRSSGFCSGGQVLILIGRSRYSLSSKAPYCTFEEDTD